MGDSKPAAPSPSPVRRPAAPSSVASAGEGGGRPKNRRERQAANEKKSPWPWIIGGLVLVVMVLAFMSGHHAETPH